MSKKQKPKKNAPITGLDGIQKAKLSRDYTQEELMKIGSELSGVLLRIRNATARFLDVVSTDQDYARTLVNRIQSGYEMVDRNVKSEFNAKTKRKKLYDLKTGEFIREEPMDETDFQLGLGFIKQGELKTEAE
jgi:hypothetical protein